ncbi:MAG TPA: transposase [Pyrinomonadaceae bacterium]|nr:transposase [Pyrinomonadaceae bacterium]
MREVSGLPLRAAQGFISSVLRLLGTDLRAPPYSTLGHAALGVELPRLTTGPLHPAVGSTGDHNNDMERYSRPSPARRKNEF